MKKLVIIFGISANLFAQQSSETPNPTQVFAGYDENGYAIYKNIKPFYTLGSKIALGICGGGITAIVTKIICDRRREDAERPETFEQENIEI